MHHNLSVYILCITGIKFDLYQTIYIFFKYYDFFYYVGSCLLLKIMHN